METTKQKLVDSIRERLQSEIAPSTRGGGTPVRFLLNIPPEAIIDNSISTLYLYTRVGRGQQKKNIYMAEVISAIGHNIRDKFKLKKDSAAAAKAGAFILYTFDLLGVIRIFLGKGASGHGQYFLEVINEDGLTDLWNNLTLDKVEKLPSLEPYSDWTDTIHSSGAVMVKTFNRDVLTMLTPETHPIIYNVLNKSQKVGWRINEDIHNIYAWALRNKTDAFHDIWELQNPEARASKLREAKTIGSIAKRFINETFYHLYYYDFRGRKYPATAYLHEQGSDLAKGLLLRADNKPIGEQGFFWLCISIASNWAGDAGREDGLKTDKIPLNDRVYWTLDNEEIILSYADSPKVNQGWMQADKPWQFLAACIELRKLRNWQMQNDMNITVQNVGEYDYESHLEVFIDGSNNGSQHLAALTKDDITAPHVNLVPSELPGDLYKYVAEHVWLKIQADVNQLDPDDKQACEIFIDTLIDIKKRIAEAQPKSEIRNELIQTIIEFKRNSGELMDKSSCVFWNRVTEPSHRRKIVKRNVMTLPYGGTAYGLGQQQIDDARKHDIPLLLFMEHKWGAYMGRAIFDDCKVSLKRPMQLLSIFEAAGREAESHGQYLRWIVPITGFPVVQHYVEGKMKKLWIQYGPPIGERLPTGYFENTLQLAICFLEDTKPSKRKQSQGASPNAIHSLDAAHLMLVSDAVDFNVTTIHDSFGCLLGDMSELYLAVREMFVKLYLSDPLKQFADQLGFKIENIEIGNLDITEIIESEYCFS